LAVYPEVQDLIYDFDYKPNTPLEKGIGEFVEWFMAYKDADKA
jgi:UDP-glucuronate 4-epimerase